MHLFVLCSYLFYLFLAVRWWSRHVKLAAQTSNFSVFYNVALYWPPKAARFQYWNSLMFDSILFSLLLCQPSLEWDSDKIFCPLATHWCISNQKETNNPLPPTCLFSSLNKKWVFMKWLQFINRWEKVGVLNCSLIFVIVKIE